MKSAKETAELRENIINELGIDITKYRDEEVAENLLDLLLFPKYIAKWVAIPLLLSLLTFVIGFFVVDLVHIQYIIYGILGFFLFFIFGVLLGVVNLGRKLGDDVSSVTDYSLGLLKNSILDIGGLGEKVNSGNRKDVLGLLFKGIIFLVTIPMLNGAIDKKIPKGGGLVKRLVGGSLAAMAGRITFNLDNIDDQAVEVDGDSKPLPGYLSAIENTKKGFSGLLDRVISIASAPFRLGTYIVGFFLILFLYLIW